MATYVSSVKPGESNITMSRENFTRISVPLDILKKSKITVDTDSHLAIKDDDAKAFMSSVYSDMYLSRLEKITFDTTLCDTCSFENSKSNKSCSMCGTDMTNTYKKYIDDDTDTLITSDTYNQILETCKVMLFASMMYETNKYSYLLIRPPGHHAHDDHHEGYCIINNAYLLSRHLISSGKARGALILDWDLHHGNGTEALVKSNTKKDVYYVSLHGYEKDFYPRTGDADSCSDIVLNVPLPRGTTDDSYMSAFTTTVVPFLELNRDAYDCIIVSNGLDAHECDPIGFMKLTNSVYVEMTSYLKTLDKKMFFLLEGGYDPDTIGHVSHDIIEKLNA